MRCVVTAGPTYEPLDEARRLTNFSTGRLGCELARHLSSAGHEVTLLLGEQATWPEVPDKVTVLRFSTGADLSIKLQQLGGDFGAVFHAAAVSDFSFGKVWARSREGKLDEIRSGKYSTDSGTLTVELVPTPKILARLREWFPQALLVGWKYEVESSRERVIEKAAAQIQSNRTDACVANGPAYGPGFGLVLRDGGSTHAADLPALCRVLEKLTRAGNLTPAQP